MKFSWNLVHAGTKINWCDMFYKNPNLDSTNILMLLLWIMMDLFLKFKPIMVLHMISVDQTTLFEGQN